jgi:hypothetical protein
MPSDDPIFLAIGRMLGRLKAARSYVRSHLPRARQTNMRSRFDRHHAHALVFHVEDKWAETLADTADMRRSLRFNHCHTGADWLQWLYTLGKVIQRLHRFRARPHPSPEPARWSACTSGRRAAGNRVSGPCPRHVSYIGLEPLPRGTTTWPRGQRRSALPAAALPRRSWVATAAAV